MKDDESIRVAPRSRATGGRGAPSLMRNVLSNWTVLGSAVLYSLLITPTVVHALDREAYGIWSFLNAFVAYSSLFYIGLGAALLRFGAQYYAAQNRAALNRLVSVVITIYSGLGLLSLLAGLVAAPYVPELFSSAIGSRAVSATVIVLAARLGLMFVGSVFSGVLVAQGRMDLFNLVTICGHLSRLLLVPFAVGAPNPMLALASAVGITGAAEVAAMAIVALRLDPSLKVRLVIPRAAELRMLYGFGVFAFLLQVADRLISYSDTVVIGITLGAGDVALYTLPLQLAEYGRLVVRGLVSVMLPHLSALLATGQIARFRSSYIRTVRVTAFVAAFVAVNLVSLGPMFLRLWVGPAFAVDAAPGTPVPRDCGVRSGDRRAEPDSVLDGPRKGSVCSGRPSGRGGDQPRIEHHTRPIDRHCRRGARDRSSCGYGERSIPDRSRSSSGWCSLAPGVASGGASGGRFRCGPDCRSSRHELDDPCRVISRSGTTAGARDRCGSRSRLDPHVGWRATGDPGHLGAGETGRIYVARSPVRTGSGVTSRELVRSSR